MNDCQIIDLTESLNNVSDYIIYKHDIDIIASFNIKEIHFDELSKQLIIYDGNSILKLIDFDIVDYKYFFRNKKINKIKN